MRKPLAAVIAAVAAVVTFGAATPAVANTISRSDRNDTAGPLDLAGFRISHSGSSNVFKFSTYTTFTNKQINGQNGWFEVDFNNNGDKYFDYWIVAGFLGGKMQGVLFDHRGKLIGRGLKFTRQSRSATLVVPLKKIGSPKSYQVRGVSVYFGAPCGSKKPCVDDVPNGLPLILHDLTPPTTNWGIVREISTDASATTTFPVNFAVKDDRYGSGVKSWILQARQYGTSTWTKIKEGSTASPRVDVTGVEGETTEVRVIAVDKQGNKSVSSERMASVPFDDRNGSFVYSASTQAAPAEAFMATTSSIGNTDTATFTTSRGWSKLCVIGGPTVGSLTVADATININASGAVAMGSENNGTSARGQVYCTSAPIAAGANSVVITGTSTEPYVIDGIVLVP